MGLKKGFSLLWVLGIWVIVVVCAPSVSAKLSINEFASDTAGTTQDPDWVELYHSGQESIDLSLYRLRDSSATNKKDLQGSIEPGGFVVIEWLNRLDKKGDMVKLIVATDEAHTIDQVAYGDAEDSTVGAPRAGQSAGRTPDGGNTWVVFSAPSQGSSNNAIAPVPSPTPTPFPTPTSPPPSHTPSPTKIPKTAKAPSPAPVSSQKVLSAETETASDVKPQEKKHSSYDFSLKIASNGGNASGEGDVLPLELLRERTVSPESKQEPLPSPLKKKETFLVSQVTGAQVLMGIGIIFLGGCAILVFQKYRSGGFDAINGQDG